MQLLLLILLLGFVLRLVFFTGTSSSDELSYYHYAHQVTEGTFSIELNHFSFRLGIIYPTALLFSLFGVNEFSANAFVLLLSLAGIFLIFLLGKEIFNERIGLISAFLLSIFPLDIFYSTRLLPDIPSAFFMALSVLLFLYAERGMRPMLLYSLSGLSIGIAYLMKEVSLLLGLFFLAYVIYKKTFKLRYLLMGIGPALAVLLIFFVSYLHTGDPFFQKHSNQMQEISFLKEHYPNYFTPDGLINRLFLYLPYNLLTNIYYGFFFIPTFISILYIAMTRKKEPHVALLWMLPILLYINFGTISMKEYVPFPLDFRHVQIIAFPSLLLIGYLLDEKPFSRFIGPALIILFVLSMGCNILLQDENQADSIKQAYRFLKEQPLKTIYADDRTALILDYLFGFSRSDAIIPYNEYDYEAYGSLEKNRKILDLSGITQAYVVVSKEGIEGLRVMHPNMMFPPEIFNAPPSWHLAQELDTKEGIILIYAVD